MSDLLVRIGADLAAFKSAGGEMERALGGMGKSVGELGNALSHTTSGPLSGFAKSLGGLGSIVSGPTHALGGLVGALGGLGLAGMGLKTLAQGVAGVATGMVSGNAEMETYETQLGTLMGSSSAAKERLAELAKFGAETPFELPEVVRAEKVLLGFGLTGEKVVQVTGKNATQFRTLVGDIAAGTGASFEEIALNMGKFASGATGEAISRFQEMGIATREQMAAMGVQFSKAGELLSPIPQAMAAIVEIGGKKFGGGMDKLSKTFSGQMSTLSDNFNQAKNVVMQPIFDVLKDSMGGINDFLSGSGFQDALKMVAERFAGIVSTVVDVAWAIGQLVLGNTDLSDFALRLGEIFDFDASGIVLAIERVTTFFGSLRDGSTLATAVNKAFGDLIPASLNPILDAVDLAFGRVKTAISELATAIQTRGLAVALEEVAGKLEKAGAPATIGALRDGYAQIAAAMVILQTVGTEMAAGLGRAFGGSGASATDWGKIIDQVLAAVVKGILLPTTAFLALVTGAAAMQTALASTWAAINTAVTDAMFLISNTFTLTWEGISGTVDRTTKAIKTAVSDAWEAVLSTTDTDGTTLREAIQTNWKTISDSTDTSWKAVSGFVEEWSGKAKKAATDAADAISSYLGTSTSGSWGTVNSNTDTAWSAVKTTITSAWDATSGIRSVVSSGISGVSTLLSGSGIGTAAAAFGNSILTGITGALSELGSGIAQKIRDAINSISIDIGIFHFRGGTLTWTWPSITAPSISLPGGSTPSRNSTSAASVAGNTYNLSVTGNGGVSNAEDIPRVFRRMELLGGYA